MFNLSRIGFVARAFLIVAFLVGLMRVNPSQAAGNTNAFADDSATFSKVSVETPRYPVGMGSGESRLVPYRISELGHLSGKITSRTYQFFTQYDVPVSESFGPFRANIPLNSAGTTDWNELIYLPKAVAEKAHEIRDYAVVLKTTFKGELNTGREFSAEASLTLLLPPDTFSKASPADAALISPTGLFLQWNSSLGAVDYEYCFDTVDNNSCDTNWTGKYWLGTYDTNAALQDLPSNTTFYWQVRANNTTGTTYANNGDWWEFTTGTSGNGSLDSTFDGDGLVTTAIGNYHDEARAVAIQPDGNILVVGSFGTSNGDDFFVARYNPDGSLDASFDFDGIVTTDFGASEVPMAMAIQPDWKIVVVGYSEIGPFNGGAKIAVARYNTDGSLDSSFSADGKAVTDLNSSHELATSVAVQTDGKIVLTGYKNVGINDNDIVLLRYTSDGSLDPTFDGDGMVSTEVGTGSDEFASSIAIQPDGKILIGGRAYNGSDTDLALLRFDSAGNLDPGFDVDGKVITDFGVGSERGGFVALQPDGKIVLGGYSEDRFLVARYSNTGALDPSFDLDGKTSTAYPGMLNSPTASDLVLQSNGKIVIAGYSNRDYDFAIARFHPNGLIDSTFDSDGLVITDFDMNRDDIANSVSIQADGKIVVAGYRYNGSNYDIAIARYIGDLVSPPSTPTPAPTDTTTPTLGVTPTIPTSTPIITKTPTRTPTVPTPTTTEVSATPNSSPTSTPVPPITIGETSILTNSYSGIGNQLVAQQVTLSQSATIQSLSYYVSTASGQLRLGIYNNNGSNPGTLVAETSAFTPVTGWNTQPVITPTLLPAGTYWLAFLPQSSSFAGRISYSGAGRYYGYAFGALPPSYSTSASSGAFHFSLYATLTLASVPTNTSTVTPTFTPSPTVTRTPTNSNTLTPTPTRTAARTATATRTPTITPTATISTPLPLFTSTPTTTSAITPTPTATRTTTRTPTSTFIPTTALPTMTSTPATIQVGETSVLTSAYSGIGNQLIAQQVTLSQSATIQSLSYYVSTASGQLRLGIYNNNGSNPGTLVAETSAFTPVTGWNTQPVITPTLLPAGTYWLAFLPQSSSFAGRISYSGVGRYYGYTFGALPASYSTAPSSGAFHFSLYATLTIASPTATPTATSTSGISCVIGNGSGSATLFLPYKQYNCGKSSYAVGVGDFNHDDRQDVALSVRMNVSGVPSSLLIFTQDVNGNLSQPRAYPGGNRAEHMAVGDVNNDGWDDVVTVNFSDNTISLFAQNSAGEFADRITYATNSGPDAVAIDDVNNDGLNDIVVAHHTHATIGVFIQQPDGALNAMTTYPSVAAGFDDLAIGDVNGDGLNDVVKMNGQGYVNSNLMVYLQNTNGSLTTASNYSIAACASPCLSKGIAIGDVTGDGRLDITLSYGGNSPSSNIAVFAQDANGNLQPSVSYPAYDIPEAVDIADVNSDGLEDVIVAHNGWLRAGVFLQEINGVMGVEALYPLPNLNTDDLAIGDLNGDQLPDLVFADSMGLVILYRSVDPPTTPTPTFTPAITSTSTRTPTATLTPPVTSTFTPTPTSTPTWGEDTVIIGETNVLSIPYGGLGNQLVAQQVTLTQGATIQSLSYYVSTTGGQLRLGIYSDSGNAPGALLAETAAFTPVAGWNTRTVLTQPSLPAGTYWLAFLPQNNTLAGRLTVAGSGRYYAYPFGSLPAAFSSSNTADTFRFSMYATLLIP